MWAPRAGYPQPRAHLNQRTGYLEYMKALLEKGADPNARVTKKVWYSNYNFDQSGVEETGSTAFWRAAYAADVDAMKLLMSFGADPNIPTAKPPERGEFGDAGRRVIVDVSGVPPVPVGGPGIPTLLASTGVGYGEGFAGNSHRFAPGGLLAGREVPGRGGRGRRQRPRPRGQFGPAPRRLPRRRRDAQVPGRRRAPTRSS